MGKNCHKHNSITIANIAQTSLALLSLNPPARSNMNSRYLS